MYKTVSPKVPTYFWVFLTKFGFRPHHLSGKVFSKSTDPPLDYVKKEIIWRDIAKMKSRSPLKGVQSSKVCSHIEFNNIKVFRSYIGDTKNIYLFQELIFSVIVTNDDYRIFHWIINTFPLDLIIGEAVY